MKKIVPVLAVCGALAGSALYLIAPSGQHPWNTSLFYHRNFAHRGLYSKDQTVPENSLPAFSLAADIGYGIEMDIQLTADESVVVFHDASLMRVCGLDRSVSDCSLSELRELRLFGTSETIPLFSEALQVVCGRVPIVVELKPSHNYPLLCSKALELMKAYPGPYCIESFDPRIVHWFRKNVPEMVRGQLSANPSKLKGSLSRLNSLMLGNCLLNFLGRPDFIAYQIGYRPLPVRLANRMGALDFGWTSHNADSEQNLDAVIFEHYMPGIRY